MGNIRTVIDEEFPEGATVTIDALIHDEGKVGVPAANLQSLVFTLYDEASDVVINNRLAVSILNTGGGTVDSLGNLKLVLNSFDGVFLGNTVTEIHVVLFEWSYASGTKLGKHEVEFTVRNMSRVA